MKTSTKRSRRQRSPSPEKTAQTRRSILAAATDVFLTKGFDETRMEDIAARAEVAKGLLYVYYANKTSLFESVVEQIAQEPLRSVGRFQPQSGESVRSFLLRTVPPLLRDLATSKRGALLRLILAEGARFPTIGATYHRLVLDPLWKGIEQLGRVALANQELRDDSLVRHPELLTLPALYGAVGPQILQDHDAAHAERVFEALVNSLFLPQTTPARRNVHKGPDRIRAVAHRTRGRPA